MPGGQINWPQCMDPPIQLRDLITTLQFQNLKELLQPLLRILFLAFIDAIAPAIVSGNTAVAIVGGATAVPAMTFAEVLATSDLPAGVINILTGSVDELAPWAASHMDIDGIDITGVAAEKRGALREAGAQNLKRIHHFDAKITPARIFAFMEAKTVWHPIGN